MLRIPIGAGFDDKARTEGVTLGKAAVRKKGEVAVNASCWLCHKRMIQAKSLEERGSGLASDCRPANGRLSWLRVKTPNECWGLPDDQGITPIRCILASYMYHATKLLFYNYTSLTTERQVIFSLKFSHVLLGRDTIYKSLLLLLCKSLPWR